MALQRTAKELDIYEGTVLGKCHRVQSFLGEGGFGFVCKCLNTQTGEKQAIKVNKSHPEIVHQAKLEIAILKKLRGLDPDTCNIVRWNGFFFHQDNICLNFELMEQSLGDFLYRNNYQPLPIEEVRPIVYQLALALSHLKSVGIIHADFKPENVMIANTRERPFRVKVIDFGLALPAYAAKPGVCLQTVMYRAPEISLHIPFDEGIDIWGLGLTVAELVLGQMLYPGYTDYQVLSFIMATQGQPEDYILDRGLSTDYFFQKDDDGPRRWRFLTPEEFDDFDADEPGYLMVDSLDDLAHMIKTRKPRLDRSDYMLVDLIQRMLELDNQKRITAADVLKHPFFAQNLQADDDSEPMDIDEEAVPEDRSLEVENDIVILSDQVKQTSEDRWQSQHLETSQPEYVQRWMNDVFNEGQASCSSKSSGPIYTGPMDSDKEVAPEDRSPEVEKKSINLSQSSLPHIPINIQDIVEQESEDGVEDHICVNIPDIAEQESEDSIEDYLCVNMPDIAKQESEDSIEDHLCVNMPDIAEQESEDSIEDHLCVNMPDIVEQESEDSIEDHLCVNMPDIAKQESEDNIKDHICIDMTVIEGQTPRNNGLSYWCPPAEIEEEEEVKPETDPDNEGWLWRVFRRIKDTIDYYFPLFCHHLPCAALAMPGWLNLYLKCST